jgi:acetylornithine deacetylase/succinyl-diaminopimelate desuccinylase-like protein
VSRPSGFAETRVENLTRRQAHAAYALLQAQDEYKTPVTAEEIVVYDEEASSVRATAAALVSAQRVGLAVFVPGDGFAPACWTPTQACYGLRGLLEERYLRETAREGEDG